MKRDELRLKKSNSPGGCVSEEFAVKQHHSADEVEAEEHGKRENQVKWHHGHVAVAIGMQCGPREEESARQGMYGTHEQLHTYLHHPTHGHRDSPVVHTVVYREQLQLMQSDTVSLSTVVNSLS